MAVAEVETSAHAFLQDLTSEQVNRLTDAAVTERIEAGHHIFRAGEPAGHFYLIAHGRVELQAFMSERGPVSIATLSAGEALGWSWLFPPFRWHFDAVALEPVRLISFDAQKLRAMCDADHELGYRLLYRVAGIMVQRLQNTRIQLLDVFVGQEEHKDRWV
jgi:CRP/FNR family transcriptional regulator, cyclic AMP receptor protein